MVEQLEAAYDQFADSADGGARGDVGAPSWPDAIPTADELGAEVERFLRDQGD